MYVNNRHHPEKKKSCCQDNHSGGAMSRSHSRREKKEHLKAKAVKQQKRVQPLFLLWVAHNRTAELQQLSVDALITELTEILGLKNHEKCVKESALLDYYLCGFNWTSEVHFNPSQTSFTMAVLHMLIDNIENKRACLVENMVELAKALAPACYGSTSEDDFASLLSTEEAKQLIAYVRASLFQKYTIYELLLSTAREESLLTMEKTIEVFGGQDSLPPLEQAISDSSPTPSDDSQKQKDACESPAVVSKTSRDKL